VAIVDISEYHTITQDQQTHEVQCGYEPAYASQQVNITASSVASAAFASNTRFVRIHTDAPCRIKFGATPTAAGTSMRMSAGSTEFFGVTPGHQVAVITTT
jgi:hypothetical protein